MEKLTEKYKKEFIKTEFFIKTLYNLITGMVWVVVYLLLFFGATTSIILLFKLYPDLFIRIAEPFFKIFNILLIIIGTTLKLFVFVLIIYLGFKIGFYLVDKRNENYEKRKQEFINKIKLELKKKK